MRKPSIGRSKRFIGTASARSTTCSEDTSRRPANFRNARSAVSRRLRLRTVLCRFVLQMVQERQDQLGLDVGQLQRRRRLAQPLAGEVQEQHQGVAVAGHGARAHRALRDQILGEELLHQRGERRRLSVQSTLRMGHLRCLHERLERLAAASAINSGTAGEIPVGVGHHRVADVGRQRQHRLIDVDALRVPEHDATNDEGVPQVVDARAMREHRG